MSDVAEEMSNQVPDGFGWFNIFLSADMTVLTLNLGITIEAIFFLSFF